MGAGNTKDGYIDMLVQTNQPYYMAGSYVDGTVYVNCKGMRNYKQLRLKLTGIQHVSWSQGSGKNRRSYSNTKNTYTGIFDLAIFSSGVIAGGHYSFPFRFLLPAEITGSMFEAQSCYIRYPLTAELISSDEKNDNQIFSKNLNIIQPIRSPMGMIQKQTITSPQCCGCCKDYGMIKLGLSCDKNFVVSGDTIQVSGYIDNTAGKADIQDCLIHLQDVRWRISSGGAIRKGIMNTQLLHLISGVIRKGENKKYSFTAKIPPGWTYSTAIGSIVSRYQVVNFTGSLGCCTGGAICEFPLIFQSTSQKLEVGPQVPPPPGWNPVVANEVLFTNLPAFHYQPNLSMPYLNRTGVSNVAQLNNMGNPQIPQEPHGYYQGGQYEQTTTQMNMY